jgi:hypothetical protein
MFNPVAAANLSATNRLCEAGPPCHQLACAAGRSSQSHFAYSVLAASDLAPVMMHGASPGNAPFVVALATKLCRDITMTGSEQARTRRKCMDARYTYVLCITYSTAHAWYCTWYRALSRDCRGRPCLENFQAVAPHFS